MTAPAALTLSNLTISASREGTPLPLVVGVDLEVEPGSVCGIVGESGAGKTLTTRAMLGLLPRNLTARGRVTVNGRTIDLDAGEDLDALAGVGGVVLQNPAAMLDPLLRMRKQLVEAVLWHGQLSSAAAETRALELLAAVGFPDPDRVFELYPHQLSGGMAQRAAIAMALMTEPAFLVIDEPTSALDANLRNEVLQLLRSLATDRDAAIVVVSHDLLLVGRFCDTVAVMYAGRIVETGRTEDVLGRARHPYTRALLATSLSPDTRPREPVQIIPGTQPAPGHWPAACSFAPRCSHAEEICDVTTPQLRHVGGRLVACHFAEELVE